MRPIFLSIFFLSSFSISVDGATQIPPPSGTSEGESTTSEESFDGVNMTTLDNMANVYREDFLAKVDSGEIEFGSNFKTCSINLWEDYILTLARAGLYRYELVLAAAEFVLGGEGIVDLWKDAPGGSIHGGLQPIFRERSEKRRLLKEALTMDTDGAIATANDIQGYLVAVSKQEGSKEAIRAKGEELLIFMRSTTGNNNIGEGDMESFGNTLNDWGNKRKQMECLCHYVQGSTPEGCPNMDGNNSVSSDGDNGGNSLADGDASGLKYKRILVYWAYLNLTLHQTIFKGVAAPVDGMVEILEWYIENDWSQMKERYLGLLESGYAQFGIGPMNTPRFYKFREWKPQKEQQGGEYVDDTGRMAPGRPEDKKHYLVEEFREDFLGEQNPRAWTVAGMFGHPSFVLPSKHSTYGSYSDIPGMVLWNLLENNVLNGRTVYRGIGMRLEYPYNEMCDQPTFAGACIRRWLNITAGGEHRILVDPWIPQGLRKEEIINVSLKDFASDDKNSLIWDKAHEGARMYGRYKYPFTDLDGDPPLLGLDYEPCQRLVEDPLPCVLAPESSARAVHGKTLELFIPRPHTDWMDEPRQKLVKDKAREYIESTGLIRGDFSEYLDYFKEYAYEFHFVFPKLAPKEALQYPLPNLGFYLQSLGYAIVKLVEGQADLIDGGDDDDDGGDDEDDDDGGDDDGDGLVGLLNDATADLVGTSTAFQPFRSQIAQGTADGQEAGASTFDRTTLSALGFGEWDFTPAEAGEGNSELGNRGGRGSLDSGRTTGGVTSSQGVGVSFSGARQRFLETTSRREGERENWEKTVGQTGRGRRLREVGSRLGQRGLARGGSGSLGRIRNSLGRGKFGSLGGIGNSLNRLGSRSIRGGSESSGRSRKNAHSTRQGTGIFPSTGVLPGAPYGGSSISPYGGTPGRGGVSAGVNAGYGMTGTLCRDGSPCQGGQCRDGSLCQVLSPEEEAKKLGISVEQLKAIRATASKVGSDGNYRKKLNGREDVTLFQLVSHCYIRNYARFLIEM